MSDSWPPILEFYYAVAKALGEEGIEIYNHGFIANPEGESCIHDDPSPSTIKIYFLGTFIACLNVYGDGDLRLRNAAVEKISAEFKTYYSVSERDLKGSKAPSPKEIALNLVGALKAFHEKWPEIKKVEDKYNSRVERIKERASVECFG